ncbi:MAG: hypothetical protein ABIO55_08780 [Ginsengibacter sp.]
MIKFNCFTSLITLCFFANICIGQIIISGTVYDSTKVYSVSGVQVKSTNGTFTFTDSAGIYHISASDKDSISFFYRDKPTVKFPVSTISDYTQFDISLRIGVKEKYKPLKEIFIFSNYRQDSVQNRNDYYKPFNYEKPGIRSTYTPGSSAGFDLDELINIFRFRRNKQHLQFQKRLIEQEEDRYVGYRFSTKFLKRVTGLSGQFLEKYRIEYRPSYEFITSITELEFYEYINYTSNKFKKDEGL